MPVPPSSRPLSLLLGLGLIAAAALPVPAQADRLRERAAADSFGNLVVWSRSGYKRIVVGKGDLAAEFNAYSAGEPEIVDGGDNAYEEYGESGDAVRAERHRRLDHAYRHDCYRAPALMKGRSYMYGLADGEIPVITPCERFED